MLLEQRVRSIFGRFLMASNEYLLALHILLEFSSMEPFLLITVVMLKLLNRCYFIQNKLINLFFDDMGRSKSSDFPYLP